MTDFQPRPEDKFTFGLWTVGNVGRDPFGPPVRNPISPVEIVHLLAEVGAYGVNYHDDDLIPIGTPTAEREQIIRDFKKALADTGIKMPMATANLFSHPIFRDGAFTSNNPKVRAFALQKTLQCIDIGYDMGASVYVMWGGREGTETDASKAATDSVKRMREAVNFITEYIKSQGYNLKVALEAKPNEPRSDIYFPTTGAMLGFIATLDHPEMVGVNPEVAHEHMSGLNFMHAVAQAWDAGKLFHVDLNDQLFGRFDQDFRFGSVMLKQNFFLVKFLEDVGYSGSRHFDAHAYRTEDYAGVRDFARGCMRTYLIFKERAARWNADPEIKAILEEVNANDGSVDFLKGGFTPEKAQQLKTTEFDRDGIAAKGLAYERLDQLTVEVLLGVR
jgi:xylose isomerase